MRLALSPSGQAFEHDVGPLAQALSLVDRRFGPIKQIYDLSLVSPQPRWHAYVCDLASIASPHFGAAGTSICPTQALTRALGEAVERLVAINSVATLPVDQTMRLDDIGFDLPRCANYESTTIAGVKGKRGQALVNAVPFNRLTDGSIHLLPAAFLHLGYIPPAGEEVVTFPISTGLAFADKDVAALWSGLCEVAERDALTTSWWTRRTLRSIDISDAPAELLERSRRIAAAGLELRLFDMTTEFPAASVS